MRNSPLRIRLRKTGAIVEEPLYSDRLLRFLYENRLGCLFTTLIFRRERFNEVHALLHRSRASRRHIPEYVRKLGIDPSEAELPLERYRTLDEFFTRRLRPGARPVDPDPDHLISPADGRILVHPAIDGAMSVKGCRLTLPELLGDARTAERYRGGAVAVVRLAPADYHRFHFCADGDASRARTIGSGLDSVHPVALSAGARSFRNKRAITKLSTTSFGDLLYVEVGAMIIGTIVQTCRPGRVRRGEEKGFFRAGGSTLVLVSEPGRVRFDDDLVESSARGIETLVTMGTRIGRRA